jgi:glycosyltransferase involved in cell wall biosynthesis
MKNILYILPVSERGGAERIVESWTSHHSAGFRAHVVVPQDGPVVQTLRKLGVNTIVPPDFRIRSLWKSVRFLADYVKAESIDLIHSTMPKAHLFGGLAALKSNCAEIWFHHGPLSSKRYQGVIPLIPSRAVLVASRYMESVQSPTYCAAKSIRRVPYGLDIEALRPNLENRTRLRSHHGISEKTLAIGMFGRLISWKGQHVVLEALRQVRAQNRDFDLHCFFVGGTLFGREPEYKQKLVNNIESSGLSSSVTLTGHVTDVYPYYDMMDVVIHASTIPEPFGLVVSEAMAKEKVVIATEGGGPSEMIQHGRTGFLYRASDASALAATLLDISKRWEDAESRQALRDIATRGRAGITSEYSINSSVSKLEELYSDILGKN